VIDGGKSTQTVVTKPEVWASRLSCHLQRKQEALWIDHLRQAVQNTGNEKHMSIFNWAHLQIIAKQLLASEHTS
jgi:truncated hemoglobin YjbI